MEIRTKDEFYRLWHAGFLGNKPRTWPTIEALLASGYSGLVGIRSVEVGGPCRYHETIESATALAKTWPCTPTFSEAMPDHLLLVQGEVARLPGGLHLTYSVERGKKMREAMQHPRIARGAAALLILRAFLWPSSYDDVEALLELYPDAVIEFGAHDCAIGVLPNRNTVIWECRNY